MHLVYKDWPYRENTKSMDFWLSKDYENVFYGYAESFDGEPVEIFINRLALQYLSPTPLPGTETGFTTGVFTHPNMMGRFSLWTVGEPLVYDKFFVYGFGGEIDTTKDSLPLSNPINGRLDPRMYVLFTKAGTVATNENIIQGYKNFEIEVSGDFDFASGATTHIFNVVATDNDGYTVSTEDDWVTVVKNGNTVEVSVTENRGSARIGHFCFNWYNEHLIPQIKCYEIEQSIADFIINITGDTTFDYSSSTNILNYEATYTPIVISYPNWVSGVTINGTSAGTISITVDENSTAYQRVGDIVLGADNCPTCSQKAISISQAINPKFGDLTFEIVSGGTIGLVNISNSSQDNKNYEAKINNGGWITKSTQSGATALFEVSAGDVVRWRSKDYNILDNAQKFSGTCRYAVYGDINNLYDKDTYSRGYFTNGGIFARTNVLNASGLTLAEPVSGSDNTIYAKMFQGCTSLVEGPLAIPICQSSSMFEGCSSLIKVPAILSVVSDNMFANCTSLTGATIPAGAEVINFNGTFRGCSNLRRVELLPEGPLYFSQFQYPVSECGKLNYIKCMTQFGSQQFDYLSYHKSDLPSTGTLVTRTGLTWTNVPDGWTVEYE